MFMPESHEDLTLTVGGEGFSLIKGVKL